MGLRDCSQGSCFEAFGKCLVFWGHHNKVLHTAWLKLQKCLKVTGAKSLKPRYQQHWSLLRGIKIRLHSSRPASGSFRCSLVYRLHSCLFLGPNFSLLLRQAHTGLRATQMILSLIKVTFTSTGG